MIKFIFWLYRCFFSPAITVLFQINCRYEESCSHYTERKINELGLLRGTREGMIRFIQCNPWTSSSNKGVKHGS